MMNQGPIHTLTVELQRWLEDKATTNTYFASVLTQANELGVVTNAQMRTIEKAQARDADLLVDDTLLNDGEAVIHMMTHAVSRREARELALALRAYLQASEDSRYGEEIHEIVRESGSITLTRGMLRRVAHIIESTLESGRRDAKVVSIDPRRTIFVDTRHSFAPFANIVDRDMRRETLRMIVGMALATTGENQNWFQRFEGDEVPPVILTAKEERDLDAAFEIVIAKDEKELSALADALPAGRMRMALESFVQRERGVLDLFKQSPGDFIDAMTVPLVDDTTPETKEKK